MINLIYVYCKIWSKDPIPELKSEPEKEEKKSEALSEDDFLPPELKALMAKNSKGVKIIFLDYFKNLIDRLYW